MATSTCRPKKSATARFAPRSRRYGWTSYSGRTGRARNGSCWASRPSTKHWSSTQTNKTTLVDALGKNPADWIGAEVGLLTEPTMMSGKPTRGVRMRVLNNPLARKSGGGAAAPAPKPRTHAAGASRRGRSAVAGRARRSRPGRDGLRRGCRVNCMGCAVSLAAQSVTHRGRGRG